MPLRLNSLQEQLEATSTDLGLSGFDLGFLSPPKGLCEWETLNSWLLALSLSASLGFLSAAEILCHRHPGDLLRLGFRHMGCSIMGGYDGPGSLRFGRQLRAAQAAAFEVEGVPCRLQLSFASEPKKIHQLPMTQAPVLLFAVARYE